MLIVISASGRALPPLGVFLGSVAAGAHRCVRPRGPPASWGCALQVLAAGLGQRFALDLQGKSAGKWFLGFCDVDETS